MFGALAGVFRKILEGGRLGVCPRELDAEERIRGRRALGGLVFRVKGDLCTTPGSRREQDEHVSVCVTVDKAWGDGEA